MTDDLYHAEIMKSAKAAQGERRLADPDASVTVDNPLCGDRVTIDVKFRGGAVVDIGHRVRGCALCQAATAVVEELAPGATAFDAASAENAVLALLDGGGEEPGGRWAPLAMFRPVKDYRSRHRCVRLPFEALRLALEQATGTSRSTLEPCSVHQSTKTE